MIKERLSARVETSRMSKLRQLAEEKKKTITAVIEDWIDTVELQNTTNHTP